MPSTTTTSGMPKKKSRGDTLKTTSKPSKYAINEASDDDEINGSDSSRSDRDHVNDEDLQADDDVSMEDDYDEEDRYTDSTSTSTSRRRHIHKSGGDRHESFVLYAVSVVRNVANLEKEYGSVSVSLTGYHLKSTHNNDDDNHPATAAELLDGIFAASPNRRGMYASPSKHTPHKGGHGSPIRGGVTASPLKGGMDGRSDRDSKKVQMLRELAMAEQEAATVMKDLRVAITNERAKAAAVIRRLQGRMYGIDDEAHEDGDDGGDFDHGDSTMDRRRAKREEEIALAMQDVTVEANRPLFVSLAGKALLEDGVVPLIGSCTTHLQHCAEEVAGAGIKVEKALTELWDHQQARRTLKTEAKELTHHRNLLDAEASQRQQKAERRTNSNISGGDTELLCPTVEHEDERQDDDDEEHSMDELNVLRDEIDNAIKAKKEELHDMQKVVNRLTTNVASSRSALSFLVRREATLKKLVLYALKLLCAVTLPIPPMSPNIAVQLDVMGKVRDFLAADQLFQQLVALTAPLAQKRLGDEQELERSKQQLRKSRKQQLRAERRAALGIIDSHVKATNTLTSPHQSPFKTPKKNLAIDVDGEEKEVVSRAVSEDISEMDEEDDDDDEDMIDAEMAAEIDNEAILASSVAEPLPKEEASLIEMTLLLVSHLLKGPGVQTAEKLLSVLCRCHLTELLLVVLHQNHYLSTVVIEALKWKESRSRSRSKSGAVTNRLFPRGVGVEGSVQPGSRAVSQARSLASSAGISSVGRGTVLDQGDYQQHITVKAEVEDGAVAMHAAKESAMLSELAARELDFEGSNSMPFPSIAETTLAPETYNATLDVRNFTDTHDGDAEEEECLVVDAPQHSSAALTPLASPEEIEKDEEDDDVVPPPPARRDVDGLVEKTINRANTITGETQLVLLGAGSSGDSTLLHHQDQSTVLPYLSTIPTKETDEAGVVAEEEEDDLVLGDDLGDLDFFCAPQEDDSQQNFIDADEDDDDEAYPNVTKKQQQDAESSSASSPLLSEHSSSDAEEVAEEEEDDLSDDEDEEVEELPPASLRRSLGSARGGGSMEPNVHPQDILLAMNPDSLRNHIRETGSQVKRWNFLVLEAMSLIVSRGSSGGTESGAGSSGVTSASASPLVGEMARLSMQQVSGSGVAAVLGAASELVSALDAMTDSYATHTSYSNKDTSRAAAANSASVSQSLAAASTIASNTANMTSPYAVLMMRKDMEEQEWRRIAKSRHGATAASSAILVRHTRTANNSRKQEVIGPALSLAPAMVKGSSAHQQKSEAEDANNASGRTHCFDTVEVVQQDLTTALSVASMIDATKKRMYTKKKLLAESAMRIAGGGGSEIRSWHENSSNSNLKMSSMFPSMLIPQHGNGFSGGSQNSRAIAAEKLRSLLGSLADSTSSSSSAIATSTTLPVRTILALSKTLHQFVDAGFELISTMLWPELRNTLENLKEACEEQRERTNEIKRMKADVKASGGGDREMEEMIAAYEMEAEERGGGGAGGMDEVAAFLQSATTGTQVSDLMMYFSLCSNLLFFARETLEHIETAMVRLQITLAECLRDSIALDELADTRRAEVFAAEESAKYAHFDTLLFGATPPEEAPSSTTTTIPISPAAAAENNMCKIRLFPSTAQPGIVSPNDNKFNSAIPGTFYNSAAGGENGNHQDFLSSNERARREELEDRRMALEDNISDLQQTMKGLYEQQWRSIAHLINDDHVDKGLHLLAAFRESNFLRQQYDMSIVVTFLGAVLRVLVGLLGDSDPETNLTEPQTDLFDESYFSSAALTKTSEALLSSSALGKYRHVHHREPAVAIAAHALASKILYSEENIKLILSVVSGEGMEGRLTTSRGRPKQQQHEENVEASQKDRNVNVNSYGATPIGNQVGLSMAGGAPHITSSYTLLLDATLQMLERISMDGFVALDGSTRKKGGGGRKGGGAGGNAEKDDGEDLNAAKAENSSSDDEDSANVEDLGDFIDDSEDKERRERRQARRRKKSGDADAKAPPTTIGEDDGNIDVLQSVVDQDDNDALINAHMAATKELKSNDDAFDDEDEMALFGGGGATTTTTAEVGEDEEIVPPQQPVDKEETLDPLRATKADDYIDYNNGVDETADRYNGLAGITSSFSSHRRALVDYYSELGNNNKYLPLLLHTLRQWRGNSPMVNTSLARILWKILEGNTSFGSNNIFCAPMLLAMRELIKALAPSFANPVVAAVNLHITPEEGRDINRNNNGYPSHLETKRQEFAVRIRCDAYLRSQKELYDVCDEAVFRFFNPSVFFLGGDEEIEEDLVVLDCDHTVTTPVADVVAHPASEDIPRVPGSAEDNFFDAFKADEAELLEIEGESSSKTGNRSSASPSRAAAVPAAPIKTKRLVPRFNDPDSFLRFEVALRCVRSLFNASIGDDVTTTLHDDTLRLFAYESYAIITLKNARAADLASPTAKALPPQSTTTATAAYVPHGVQSKAGLEEDAYLLYKSIIDDTYAPTPQPAAVLIGTSYHRLTTAPQPAPVTTTTTTTRVKTTAGRKRTRDISGGNEEESSYAIDKVGIFGNRGSDDDDNYEYDNGPRGDNNDEDIDEEIAKLYADTATAKLGGGLKSAIRTAVKKSAAADNTKRGGRRKEKTDRKSKKDKEDEGGELSHLDKAARKALKKEKKRLRGERKKEKSRRKAEKKAAKKLRKVSKDVGGAIDTAASTPDSSPDEMSDDDDDSDDPAPPPSRKSGANHHPVVTAEHDDDDDLLLEIGGEGDDYDDDRRFTTVGAGTHTRPGLQELRVLPRPNTQDMVELEIEE